MKFPLTWLGGNNFCINLILTKTTNGRSYSIFLRTAFGLRDAVQLPKYTEDEVLSASKTHSQRRIFT